MKEEKESEKVNQTSIVILRMENVLEIDHKALIVTYSQPKLF